MLPLSMLSTREIAPPGLGLQDKVFSALGCMSHDGESCPGLVPCNTNTDPSASRNVLTPAIESAGGGCRLVTITTQDLLPEASMCLGSISDTRAGKEHFITPVSSEPSTTRNPGSDLQKRENTSGRDLRGMGSQLEEQICGQQAGSLQRQQARLSLSLRLPDPTLADGQGQLSTTMLVSPHVVTQLQQQLSPLKLSTPLRTPHSEERLTWIPEPANGKVRLRPVAMAETLSPISPLPSPVHFHTADVHLGLEPAAIDHDTSKGEGYGVEHQFRISVFNPDGRGKEGV